MDVLDDEDAEEDADAEVRREGVAAGPLCGAGAPCHAAATSPAACNSGSLCEMLQTLHAMPRAAHCVFAGAASAPARHTMGQSRGRRPTAARLIPTERRCRRCSRNSTWRRWEALRRRRQNRWSRRRPRRTMTKKRTWRRCGSGSSSSRAELCPSGRALGWTWTSDVSDRRAQRLGHDLSLSR